jgi:hypothetical protein
MTLQEVIPKVLSLLSTVLCNDILHKLLPLLREYFVFQVRLMLGVDIGVLDAVEAEFLYVADVQVPCDECHQVVHGDALIAEETGVVAGYRGLQTLVKHEAHGMAPEVDRVAQEEVADRADLNADASLFHFLLKRGVQEELEAVPQTLRPQEDRVEEVLVETVMRLPAVEEAGEGFGIAGLPV